MRSTLSIQFLYIDMIVLTAFDVVFERKILRRIFGPTKENRVWRIKTNEELDKLIKHKNIRVNYIII
jgi:hypothetical protein